MVKSILKTTILAFVLFSVISFITFLSTLIYNILIHHSPKMQVGFPFKYYYQFYVRDECNGFELIHGTNSMNFILDYIISLIIILLINKFYLKQQTTKQ
jgi:hypothetical protein